MGSRRRTLAVLVAATWALSACAGGRGLPTGPAPTRKPVKPQASTTNPNPRPGVEAPALTTKVKLPEGLATRVIDQAGPATQLTGKVKLLSDQGAGIIAGNTAGIISNNTGGLISDHGSGLVANNSAGIVSNNAGGLVSNNSGSLTGKTKYALAQDQAAPVREFLLADALITVHDASGRALVGKDGQPIAAVSDGQGGYTLKGALPAENLVLRIRLWNGGELSAILPRGAAGAREVAIDTSATLGATYVLSQFVKGDQKTFDKLPQAEADRLRADLDAARGLIAKAPDYQPEALVALTDDLRKQAPTVDKTLADIEVLLLGGLGDGLAADRVALNNPHSLLVGPDGTLYIGEASFGRVRTVSPAGLLTTLVDGTGGKIAFNAPDLMDMALAPDGTLYLVSQDGKRVFKVPPTGAPTVVVSGGTGTGDPAGRKATELALEPNCVALAPDGTLYVGLDDAASGLLAVAPDGTTTTVAGPPWNPVGNMVALAAPADGTLLALRSHGDTGGQAWRRGKDGVWTPLLKGLHTGDGDIAQAPDGTVYVVEEDGKKVWRILPDGTTAQLVGPEAIDADLPRFDTPTSAAVGPDGTLYVGDRRTNLVHARKPDGTWRLVAGASGGAQMADGFLPFNGPAGVAFDPEGRMIVAESTGHAVSRFDGSALTKIAGGIKGDAGDGGPATDARFDTPGALTFKGADLLVMDSRNQRIRVIGPDGTVRPLVGREDAPDETPLRPGVPREASSHGIKGGSSIAVGPDGLIYWAASGGHQVARLNAAGQVELVAGRPYAEGEEKGQDQGTDGTAASAGLMAPLGIAFDAKGDLLVADTGNMRIRKITGLAPGGQPRIEPFAGVTRDEMLVKLFGLEPGWERAEEGAAATGAMLVGPAALCFDAAGALYFTESGTSNIAALTFEGDSVGKETGLDLKLLPPVPPRVRKITPDGKIYTVGGPGAPLFDPAKGEGLGLPTGLAIDPQGRLVVVDVRENAIRLVPKGGY